MLEIVTRTALLGVAFWDSVSGRAVADGLTLTELRSGTAAVANAGGVFALHDLPGMRASAFGAGDPAFWGSPPAHTRSILELRDSRRRFLDFRFSADAPTRGLFDQYCTSTSPPDGPVGVVPLFSSPTRPVPAGIAVVRADLWDLASGREAAWALVEVTAAGQVHRGVAGPDGRVAVFLPYPEPQSARHLAPRRRRRHCPRRPGPCPSRSSTHRNPAVLQRVVPAHTPQICVRCSRQADATALDSESPIAPLAPQTLAFGRDLVLRSAGQSVLLVLPA